MAEETEIIYTRLSEIQRELKAPKTQWNSFGKYFYRSCEDIVEGVKPLLQKGETLTFSDKPCIIGDWHYIEATASFNRNALSVSTTGYAREPETKKGMDDSQISGTASSYARKYAANGLFGIDDTKDADTQDNRGQGAQVKKPQGQNKQQDKKKQTPGGRPFKEALTWLEGLRGKPPEVIEKSWLSAQVFLGNTYSAEELATLKVKYQKLVSESLQK